MYDQFCIYQVTIFDKTIMSFVSIFNNSKNTKYKLKVFLYF